MVSLARYPVCNQVEEKSWEVKKCDAHYILFFCHMNMKTSVVLITEHRANTTPK